MMKGVVDMGGERKVIKTRELYRSSIVKGVVAMALWIGSIHLNLLLLLFAVFFLPFSKSLMVFGLLFMLMFIPIDEENKWGHHLCRFICRHACTYFPVTLHVEDVKAFHPDGAYVFGYEPHSVFSIGIIALTNHAGLLPIPKIKVLASSTVFYTPFLRHIWTWCGFSPVSRKNFTSLLADGYSCVVVPGGIREAFHMQHDTEILFLKERKGFVRIAMENGTPLVPVFCFGQSQVYNWWKPGGEIFLRFCRAIKYTPIVFWGIFGSPLPFQRPMHVVIGRPIELKKTSQPTVEEVVDVHNQFVKALIDLFERHKEDVGYADLQQKIL